jgi:non-homologous end joining protein Ku
MAAEHGMIFVEDRELKELHAESSHTIEIDEFVPIREADPRYFEAPYYNGLPPRRPLAAYLQAAHAQWRGHGLCLERDQA